MLYIFNISTYFWQIAWKIGPQVLVYCFGFASWAAVPLTLATNYEFKHWKIKNIMWWWYQTFRFKLHVNWTIIIPVVANLRDKHEQLEVDNIGYISEHRLKQIHL